MSIDTEKHRDAILSAFNGVVSDKKPEDWALFGYEGQTNVLKVVSTGEDGLEELADDLNSSKIMYAVVKVLDPKTTRPKIVLINWQGEGAPTVRKGTCARHLQDIRRLLQGIHVTINARTEEEVEPEVVMAAVLKASATSYNFNERSEMSEKTTPVGTNYKRTNPLAEIDSKSRNKFWEQQEEEEKRRKVEEQQRKEEELKRLEKERKQREISEAQHREQLTKERNARILSERQAEEAASARLMAAQQDQRWQQEVASQQQEETERSRRAEMMRQERKKEAEALIGGRTHVARDKFESATQQHHSNTTTATNRPPPRRLKEFNPVNSPRDDSRDGHLTAPSRGVAARWPPAAAADSPQQLTSPAQHRGVGVSNVRTPVQDMIPAPSNPPAAPCKQPPQSPQTPLGEGGYVRNLLKEGLPRRQQEEEEVAEEEEEWEEEKTQPPPPSTSPPTSSPTSQPQYNQPVTHPTFPPSQPYVPPSQPSFLSSKISFPPSQPYVRPSQPTFPPSQPTHPTYPPSQPYHVPSHTLNNNSLNSSNINNNILQDPQPPAAPSKTLPSPSPPQHQENGNLHSDNIYCNIDNLHQTEVATHNLRNGISSSLKLNGMDSHHHYQQQQHTSTSKSSSSSTPDITTTATHDTGIGDTTANENAGNQPPHGGGMLYEVDGVEYQILPEHGLCARALYDYQAADDTEITFDPSEIITNIDQIDEGWWQGVGPDGMYGLFPANYVELINQVGAGGGEGGGGV